MRTILLSVLVLVAGPSACADEPPGSTQPSPPSATTQPAARTRTPLKWHRPRFDRRQAARNRMVANQMAGRGAPPVNDPRVLDALRQVPRHRFVPESLQARAYDDTPLPIGHGQTISQPYIVGLMTQLLRIKPGDKVLEIGTGSAYQAAVLSELTPFVYTIEIVDPLGRQADARLKRLGYKTVQALVGDGYYGWKKHAPFDAIIVTCAATHEPPPLLRQLKPGGRLCIPVGRRWGYQSLRVVERTQDGGFRRTIVLGVAFVPLTGGHD